MSKQRTLVFRPVLFIGVLCVLCMLWLPELQAAPPTMPPRPPTATPVMPPRPPTVEPTTEPSEPSAPSGAIELWIQFRPDAPADMTWRENLLTVVEWRDSLGDWHVVDGWQAKLDEAKSQHGRKIWYVSEDLFGKGPFVWVIYPNPTSDPIAVSLPFDLPSSAGVVVRTELELGEPVPLPPRQLGSGETAPVAGGQRDFTALRASLTVILIALLLGSLLFRGWRRRIE
jgi:hypothetical protein